MTFAEKHIIDTYLRLFESLNSKSKTELVKKLATSLKNEKKSKEDFFKSFGAFGSKKSAEEIIGELKESRNFRAKDFKL